MRTLLALLTCFTVGCSHLTLTRSEEAVSSQETHDFAVSSYLLGFLTLTKLPPVTEICIKSRLESVDMKMESSDVLLTIVTLGLYVPHRVVVTCGKRLAQGSTK